MPLGRRWVCFAPVLLAGALLLAAVRLVPRQEPPPLGRRGFDLPGAPAAAGACCWPPARSNDWNTAWAVGGWRLTTASALAALPQMVVFVTVERWSAAPPVRLRILRKTGRTGRPGRAALRRGLLRLQFVVTLYAQELRGWSSLRTALALVIMGCDAVPGPRSPRS
jgi:hypothetical protein